MPRLVDHGLAQAPGHRPVIRQASCPRVSVLAGGPAGRLVDVQTLSRGALTGHRRAQHIPAPTLGGYRLAELEQRGDRHLDTTLRRVDDRKVARLDPAVECCVADAKNARGESARHRLPELELELGETV